MPEPKDVKPVRLDLTPDQHKRLRLAAASAEMSMAEFARQGVLEAIARQEARHQPPAGKAQNLV